MEAHRCGPRKYWGLIIVNRALCGAWCCCLPRNESLRVIDKWLKLLASAGCANPTGERIQVDTAWVCIILPSDFARAK